MTSIICPRCHEMIPKDRHEQASTHTEGLRTWNSCEKCNCIFPSPAYRSDVPPTESHSFPVEILRSTKELEIRFPSEGLLSKCSMKMFLLWLTLIYTLIFGWIGLWLAIFIYSALLGKEIHDVVGVFMVVSIFVGLLSVGGGVSSLLWRRPMICFGLRGVAMFELGLFLPHRSRWIPRKEFITLQMETYIADKYCPETRYQLRLDTHADQRYGNGRMDIFSLPIARKEMVDFLAAEIVAFLELLPPTRESKPTKGILDKQLHGTTPFYFLYCPACRKQHTIQPDDFNNGWKRYWFQCEFCNHSVEFEKALFVEGVLPTQHKPKLGRLRNKITLQEKSRFWEEYLVIHTKSHVGMLGFWVLPYLVGIIVGYALIVFGIFGLFAYLSFASGDYRPIYHSIPLAGIAVFLTTTWAIPCFIRNEFSRWKLEMSSSGIAYSFGLWNWTIRRRKHIETLKICRRNRNTVSVSSDDPLNPAGQCRHAVVLFDDDQVWGAIPCRDELEVDHIYNLLNQYWNSFTQNEKQKNESTC